MIFLGTVIVSYLLGLTIYACKERAEKEVDRADMERWYAITKTVLVMAILSSAIPLLLVKNSDFFLMVWFHREPVSWIVPMGISFYTLQIISYHVDIYKGRIRPQKDLFKYILFLSFFPQIFQGPIPRYEQLEGQLWGSSRHFDERAFSKGLHLIVWGFFLKFMIADKAGVIVDTVFGEPELYRGCYVLVAGALYSVQLYADFLSCVTISQGVAGLFGICLADNFMHPYRATSVKDFWRRWHISLSTWLRDYIYIPLGGNRKGRICRYVNMAIVFGVSGLWHGAGYRYLFWGLLHAVYQIVGEVTGPSREMLYDWLKIPKGAWLRETIQKTATFFWVMLAWIIFRVDCLKQGIRMVLSIFGTYNPWILSGDHLFQLGLSWKECMVLLFAIAILGVVSHLQEKICIRDWLLGQHIVVRWTVYLGAIAMIWVFGTYGHGFKARDFIYGGF